MTYYLRTKYSVVRDVFSTFSDWRPADDDDSADVVWYDCIYEENTLERCLKLQPYQRFNHFAGMCSIYRKCKMAKNLNKMRKVCGDAYAFYPESWILPQEMTSFLAQFTQGKRTTFILKPDKGFQGQGIVLVQDPRNVPKDFPKDPVVAQRYIADPLLLDGYKFDVRFHVLVTSCEPLRVFVHRYGVARLASSRYEEPARGNIRENTVHITNPWQNSHNANYKPDDAEHGHRRRWDSVCEHLHNTGVDVPRMCAEIDEIIVKTLIVAQPYITSGWHASARPKDFDDAMSFEILGFDIMLDSTAKPWLLEVNHMPSFVTDHEIDQDIKRAVLTDAVRILNVTPKLKQEHLVKRRSLHAQCFHGSASSSKQKPQEPDAAQSHRTARELSMANSYRMILPCPDGKDYTSYVEAAASLALGRSVCAIQAGRQRDLDEPILLYKVLVREQRAATIPLKMTLHTERRSLSRWRGNFAHSPSDSPVESPEASPAPSPTTSPAVSPRLAPEGASEATAGDELTCSWSTPENVRIDAIIRVLRAYWHETQDQSCTFVDLCCGDGQAVLMVCDAFPECRVVGMDVYEPSLNWARSRVQLRGFEDRCELRARNTVDVDLVDASAVLLSHSSTGLSFLLRRVLPRSRLRRGALIFTMEFNSLLSDSSALERVSVDEPSIFCYMWLGAASHGNSTPSAAVTETRALTSVTDMPKRRPLSSTLSELRLPRTQPSTAMANSGWANWIERSNCSHIRRAEPTKPVKRQMSDPSILTRLAQPRCPSHIDLLLAGGRRKTSLAL